MSSADGAANEPNGGHGGAAQHEIADVVSRIISGKASKKDMRQLAGMLKQYVRVGRQGVRFNGKGIVDLLLFIAPRLPVRDVDALQRTFGTVSGGTMAGQVIRSSSRNSAAIGGITGALATAGELAPPLWLTLPVEILAETLVVTAIEMRMVAELHEVYGRSFTGTPEERGVAILEAWSTRRGVDMDRLRKNGRMELTRDGSGVAKHFTRAVSRKIMGRAVRNLGTLAPLFVGAVIGAETNRRSTRDIGGAIVEDLSSHTAG